MWMPPQKGLLLEAIGHVAPACMDAADLETRCARPGMQGHIMDSKEYLAPIITPAEALEAFAPGAPPAPAHSAGFAAVLAAAAAPEPPNADLDGDGEAPSGLALATRPGSVLSNGAAPLYWRQQGFGASRGLLSC